MLYPGRVFFSQNALARIRRGQAPQQVVVGHLDGVALDHHVKAHLTRSRITKPAFDSLGQKRPGVILNNNL
jgi:hypothetical protein